MKKLLLFVSALSFVTSAYGQAKMTVPPSRKEETRTEQTNYDGRVPVPTGRYITGGVLGSAIGFGIGHGVQGRYADKGWIFTVTEAVGLTLALPAAVQCYDDNKNKTDKECTSSQRSMIAVGYGLALGFHIWEIVDVWTGATPVDQDTMGAFVLPTNEGAQAGFVYRF